MKVEFSKSEIKFMRVIWACGILLLIVFFLFISYSDSTSGWDLYYLNKLEKEYKGEIVDIYINKNNRSIPTIILEDNSEMEILSQWKNHFQIGDYVLKEKGSIIIKLV